MRASEALTYEPAACWQRLQAAKSEFFFEDLEQLMKERHRQFLEALMGYERQCLLRNSRRIAGSEGFLKFPVHCCDIPTVAGVGRPRFGLCGCGLEARRRGW